MLSNLFADVKQFEQRLGVPEGFYRGLLQEDDWSFVIKLNALFEAACNHILATRLHAPALEESFAYIDLANSKYGKIALLRKLGALTSDQASVLRALAELRNMVVHNVRNVSFGFTGYVASMDKQQVDNLAKTFGHGVADEIRISGHAVSRRKFVCDNPKVSLWLTAAEILACLHVEVQVARLHLQELAFSELANLTSSQA